MRSKLVLHAVDSHTEGMPTRVITGGVGTIPGATMNERRLWFREHRDDVKQLLMNEPRGHAAMSGAILQPPTRPDCDWGVVYIEVSGYLPMCGHGTIGVATVLVETGMVEVAEPVTTIRLDTPAGLVVAEVAVEGGAAKAVTLRNVPSFCVGLDRKAVLPDGRTVTYDLAYGGNFYAILPLAEFGLPFDRSRGGGAGPSRGPDDPRLSPRPPVRAGCHRPALPACDGHPSGLVRPLPVRDGHQRAHGATARARGTAPAHRVRERVVHRYAVHGTPARHDGGRRRSRGAAQFHRACVGHGHGAVPAGSRGPLPGGLRALAAAYAAAT
jgi:proline racemase